MKAFHQKSNERERERLALQRHAFHLSMYGEAEGNERQRVWESFRVLLRSAPKVEWSKKAIDLSLALKRDYWIFKSIGGQPTNVPLVCEPNLLSLIAMQMDLHRQVTVKFSTYPYVQTLEAITDMDRFYGEQAIALEKEIESIRRGTYDLWRFDDLIKLTGVKE